VETTAADVAAQRYLSEGAVRGIPDDDLASRCETLIQRTARQSLKRALTLARKYVRRARSGGGPLAISAYRTLARTCHMSGAHQKALEAYLKARRLVQRDPLARARIDRALTDVYMYLGDFAAANLAARRAIATFQKLGAKSDLAQARVNFANVLHRRDRHRDAERLYREAGEYFEATGDKLAAVRCHYNRANTLVQLFDFDAAEQLYETARHIYDAEGYDLDANDARYGLAWLRMLSGDFHIALLELSACEAVYREGGDVRGEALCGLDRAEVYLGLGLYSDALDAAREAEGRFGRIRLRYERAKAALFRAQAAFALGGRREARNAAERARSGFAAEDNQGFLGAALLLTADLAGTDRARRNAALKQARAHFNRAQLPLWEAVCDLKRAADPAGAARILERVEHNAAVHHVPHLYAGWQTTTGDLKYRRGERVAACRHWESAADRLDRVRANLPPVELRTAYLKRSVSPHARLISAELDHDPLRAAVWSERYKTAGVWSPISRTAFDHPSRRRAEAGLVTLARQVAALAGQMRGQHGERGLPQRTGARALTALQKQLRAEMIRLERNGSAKTDTIEALANDIRTISEHLPIVQWHVGDKNVIAFVHDRGHISLCSFPDGRERVENAMRRWRYILEGELLVNYLNRVNVADAEAAFWREVGQWLWAPLEVRRDAPAVLILPEGELANLPWPALIDAGQPLIERHQVILAPSLRHYTAARSLQVRSESVGVFRGRAEGLPCVDRELQNLAELAGGAAAVHNPCRRENWPSAGDFRIWHYAGHARLRCDNPFYSCLDLDDGPLFAIDFRFKDCRVGLATLASCRSGEQIAMPGEEATGLVRSLLEMGSRNVLAGHWPVSDETTALWMRAFYREIFAGQPIHAAARHAALTVRESRPSAYHWAAFALFGAGD